MNWRIVAAIAVAAVAIAFWVTDAIPQDPNYHLFADTRSYAGLPNFANVISNAPFLLVGLAGLVAVARSRAVRTQRDRLAWLVFFSGIAATSFGSGYYHWTPGNETLFWDRVPMTVAFMSLLSIVIAEFFDAATGRKILLPLLIVGVASVVYWAHTESLVRGDLRPYALVQFVPLLLVPVIVLMRRQRSDLSRYFLWMFAFYVAAKFSESYDRQLFAISGEISGHALKHVLAALAPAALLLGLYRRAAR